MFMAVSLFALLLGGLTPVAEAGAPASQWVDAGAGTFAPTSAPAIRVLDASADQNDLPDGFRVHIGPVEKTKDRIELLPGYPTRGDPHVLLGAVGTTRSKRSDEVVNAALAKEAAAHGGDLVVIASEHHSDNVIGLVYHVPKGTPPNDPRSAATLLGVQTAFLKGYAASGQAIQQPMNATTAITVPGKRGTCYAMAYATEAGGAFSAFARIGISAKSEMGGVTQASSPPAHLWPTFRGDTVLGGCPQQDGPLTFEVTAAWNSGSDPSRAHDLGTGTLVYQLYTRSVGEAELADRAAKEAASLRAAHEASARLADKACSACLIEMLFCSDKAHCSELNTCLAKQNASASDCGF